MIISTVVLNIVVRVCLAAHSKRCSHLHGCWQDGLIQCSLFSTFVYLDQNAYVTWVPFDCTWQLFAAKVGLYIVRYAERTQTVRLGNSSKFADAFEGNRLIPRRAKRIFPSPKCPDWPWGPPRVPTVNLPGREAGRICI